MPSDRVPKHKQRLATNQQEAPNSVSNRQAPNKSEKRSNGPEQKTGTWPSGTRSKESTREEGIDKEGNAGD